jgi:F420-non-reducing hydrogenase small subunit
MKRIHREPGRVGRSQSRGPEGEITIPEFYNTVKTLGQVVDVDYFMPGCPKQADLECRPSDRQRHSTSAVVGA